MKLIEIVEQSSAPDGGFRAYVRFEGHPLRFPITVADPARQSTEELLNWYFESYPRFPYRQGVDRERAEDALAEYGTALFEQVFRRDVADGDLYRRYADCRDDGLEKYRLSLRGGHDFHRLHWEALRDPRENMPLAVSMLIQRVSAAQVQAFPLPDPRPTLNILVVSARPLGAGDVGYRTISRTLISTSWNARKPVQVDLARPGTWKALVRHLDKATRDHGKGWYHAIHFDLHGEMLSEDELRGRITGGRFAPHGRAVQSFAGERAFLYFEAGEEGKADPVPVQEIAELLAQSRTTVAVLNACQSAQASAAEAGLAQKFAEAGVPVVVGMAYTVTVSAAELAVPLIYQNLAEGRTPAEAVREARLALYRSSTRNAAFDQTVEMQDWLLPVLFQQQDISLELATMTQEQSDEYHRAETNSGEEPVEVAGRDADVLAIERRMLDLGADRQLLIHGGPGAGRSDLLRLLAWWWVRTGVTVRAIRIPLGEGGQTVRGILDEIAQQVLPGESFGEYSADWEVWLGRVTHYLRPKSYLIILDGVDTGLAVPERAKFVQLLGQLRSPDSLVLMSARADQDWLPRLRISRYEPADRPAPADPMIDPPLADPPVVDPPVVDPPVVDPPVIDTPTADQPVIHSNVVIDTPSVDASSIGEPGTGGRKPGRRGWRPAGLGAGLVVIAAVAVAFALPSLDKPDPGRSAGTTTTSSPAATTPAARATADPAWVSGPAVADIVITTPAPGARLSNCVTLRGTAGALGADETLVIAIRRSDKFPGDPFQYYLVTDWDRPASLAEWSAPVALGKAVWQDVDLIVLIADLAAVSRERGKPSPATIAGFRRAASVTVHQSSTGETC